MQATLGRLPRTGEDEEDEEDEDDKDLKMAITMSLEDKELKMAIAMSLEQEEEEEPSSSRGKFLMNAKIQHKIWVVTKDFNFSDTAEMLAGLLLSGDEMMRGNQGKKSTALSDQVEEKKTISNQTLTFCFLDDASSR